MLEEGEKGGDEEKEERGKIGEEKKIFNEKSIDGHMRWTSLFLASSFTHIPKP